MILYLVSLIRIAIQCEIYALYQLYTYVRRIHSCVRECARVCASICDCVRLYTSVCESVPVCVSVCENVPVCASVCDCVPVCAWVCQCMWDCTSVCESVPVCVSVCQCVREYASVCQCVPVCANTYTSNYLSPFAAASPNPEIVGLHFGPVLTVFRPWTLLVDQEILEAAGAGADHVHVIESIYLYHDLTLEHSRLHLDLKVSDNHLLFVIYYNINGFGLIY